jgi:hypothetical protein
MKKWVPAFQFLGIGFYIATCIGGGIMLGWWLGAKKPVFVIAGLVFGMILAFIGVYSMVKPLLSNKNGKNDKENG